MAKDRTTQQSHANFAYKLGQAALDIEDTAYALAGDIEKERVAELILIAARLEDIAGELDTRE